MSIRKLKGEYHVHCDAPGCGAQINSQCRVSKTQAWHVAKLRGWIAKNVKWGWRHYCGKACEIAAANAPVDRAAE